jgi:hypothetical protein
MGKYFLLLLITSVFVAPAFAQKTGNGPVNPQYALALCKASFTKFKFDGLNNPAGIQKLLLYSSTNISIPISNWMEYHSLLVIEAVHRSLLRGVLILE